MPEEVGHGPSHVGVIAHTAAYAAGEHWLDDLLQALGANRDLLATLLADHLPQVTHLRPQATYMAWLDCRALGFPDLHALSSPGVASDLDGPAAVFLDRARVALSSGHVFGTGGSGHVRLNFACAPQTLTEAVRRMGRAVADGDRAPGTP